jgi:hypothetical protein
MRCTCPDLDARLFFDPDEIQAAYLLNKKLAPPAPKLNDVLRMIARAGGFLARKGDGEPGAKTIWEGLRDVRASAHTIKTLMGDITDPSVVAIRLGDVPRIVVAAPALQGGGALPAHPDELARLPWIAVSHFYRDEVTLTHAQRGETARLDIRPRPYTDNLYAMRNAVVLGVGAAIGSRWALR